VDRISELYGEGFASRVLSFSPQDDWTWGPFLAVIALQWFFQVNSDGTGYLAQRTMGCRSDDDARRAGLMFTVAQILVRSLLWLPIAVALLVIYPFDPNAVPREGFAAGREMLFATGMRDLLPPLARGIMLTGMLAALASTLDTHLSWGASYWSNDLYGRLICRAWLKRRPGRREQVLVARLSNLLVLGFALAIMTQLPSIQSAWRLSLLFGAGMGAVLVFRWLSERVNLWSEAAAIASSLITAPALLVWVEQDWLRLVLMSGLTTGAVMIVTILTPPTHPQTLTSFYQRVRPPGFWRKTAARLGEDPNAPIRALGHGLRQVLLWALTIFLLLVGLGKLLLPRPEGWEGTPWVLLGLGAPCLWLAFRSLRKT
jgi:Na+/proline symporter